MSAAGALAPGKVVGPRRALALVAAVSLAQLVWAPPVAAATDLLPDLKMAPMYGFELQKKNGHVRLRFGTIVWNIGLGPLEARGSQREGRRMTRLVQIVKRSDGDTRTVTPAGVAAFYSGDGHDHWHVGGFVVASLYPRSMADGTVTGTVRALRKIGFCLTNLVKVPLAQRPANSGLRYDYPYTGCGKSTSVRFKMGISVGWGDDYKSWFAHQAVDITGMAAGEYRLCATPNANGAWLEVTRTNNSGWTDLYINPAKNELRIIAQGETECQPQGSSFAAPVIYWPSGPGIAGGVTN
jgi:hypothetical protein